ncbi:MAG: type II 3-dehydroquinate dehydratase [Candidatus Borkfalkiaceae bacterium]|nr:type II 3-dehydroquinate dehydratase [Clostridia bacterium]MDY6223280.1 type II 3-dehydroquinate dehydratase [Christensenellaceae bacterium]
MKFLIINGPNLNFLGIREPEIYGNNTYRTLKRTVARHAKTRGVKVKFFQSNHEGALVDAIQRAYFKKFDGIVINPAAYTHTSVALADALKAVKIPAAEVHISNVSAREEFRKISYVRSVCVSTVTGEGFNGYLHALNDLIEYARNGKLPQNNEKTACQENKR